MSQREFYHGSCRESSLLLTAAWATIQSSQSRKAGALLVLHLGIMRGGQGDSMDVRAKMEERQ